MYLPLPRSDYIDINLNNYLIVLYVHLIPRNVIICIDLAGMYIDIVYGIFSKKKRIFYISILHVIFFNMNSSIQRGLGTQYAITESTYNLPFVGELLRSNGQGLNA